ncbi:MAG: sialidase family protein [Eubacteriales bacterium]|nr:sialidase family protein [Eubacteriales bacterium]
MLRSTLFSAETDGYSAYRIPTCICLPGGRLIVFIEGRRNSLADYGCIHILARISDDGGRSFGAPFLVASDRDNTVGNPCPVYDRDTGRLHLLFNGNRRDGGETLILQGKAPRSVFAVYSDDAGESWSPLRDITPQVKQADWTWHATGPCHALQLRSGRLIVPCNHAVLDAQKGASGPYISGTLYSDDHGESWHAGADVGEYTNECTLAELPDATLYVNMRSYHGKNRRAVARSADEGASWSAIELDEALVEPVCQGSVLSDGAALFFLNPAATERRALTLRKSCDGGRTWPCSFVLHQGPAAYSDVASLPDGSLFAVFECGEGSPYERVDAAILAPSELA